jgi:hypothetical protein
MEFPPLPIDPTAITIGGLGLIPTIVFLLQILKSYFPDNTPAKVWSSFALLMGVGGVFLAQYDAGGIPANAVAILVLIVTGLVVGTAAQASYDHAIRNRPVIYQEMSPPTPYEIGLAKEALKARGLTPGGEISLTSTLEVPETSDWAVLGADGRFYDITVNAAGQLVAVPLDESEDEEKTEPVELGKPHSGTSDFSEG